MATSKERDKEQPKGQIAMKTPSIVSQQEWEAARQQLLVKEKALTRSRDALAADRRPPTMIGGCGFCLGLGHCFILSKFTNSP